MTAKRIETVRQRKRRLAVRVAAARERGRKLVDTARARARKLVETARARARKLVETARGPKVRPAVKEGSTKRKRKPKTRPKAKTRGATMAKGAFADQVLKVVRSKKPKKFGDKAFIVSVWQVGFASEMPLGEFKRRLVVEHQQGRLELSRADLVPAMDQVMVERSETAHLNATWHLIRPTAPAPVVASGTAKKVQAAYVALREETGLRNVAIADLQRRSGVPRQELLEYLQIECSAHRANPTLGEPTAATKAELEHALQIGGRPHIYVELLGSESAPRLAKPVTNTIQQAAQFRKALGAVIAENRPNALLSVREVRERAKLPKAVFDAIALGLASKRLLILHHHDFPTSLSAAERAELIVDPKGTYYVGMALPRIESPTQATEVDTAILRTAKTLTRGREQPVRIARLRGGLPAIDADTFDRALTRLHADGKVVLYRDDNRMTADDRGAYFVGGEPRHLLYLKD